MPLKADKSNSHKAFENIRMDLQKSFDSVQKSLYSDPDTYSGSWPTHVTRAQAETHVKSHGGPDKPGQNQHWSNFLKDVGDKPRYHKDQVLNWLGY